MQFKKIEIMKQLEDIRN